MSFHTIKDHDHDLRRTEKRESGAGDGYTLVKECRDSGCDYWRATYRERPQTRLDTFAG